MNSNRKNTEYAIVDIETTGGHAAGSRITEIAILIHDGEQITDRFETLVNPEKDIPLPIFALTGIDNDLVQDAPIFGDIAARVYALLEGRVFVAHHVNFDYSFVRHQLEAEGFRWTARKLCTVRMARKIRPGLPSYSLGRLCDYLGIPLQNRHRAGGDAAATAILFSRLLEWDTQATIPDMLKKTSREQQLPPNLPKADVEVLPESPGVYYFRDRAGKVIYVGKAINIRKRVVAHFSGHNPNPQRQHFLREIHGISFESCATELMAFLLECMEIKRLWPVYNRALKRFEPKFGLFVYEDINGYLHLSVDRLRKHQPCIQTFNREYDGIRLLRELIHQFGLDSRLCRFGQPANISCTRPGIGAGNNPALPDRNIHNSLVEQALQHIETIRPSFFLLDKGRHNEEKSCIWVEKGSFYAMGYIADDTDLSTPEDIRDSLTRYPGNHYMIQLIMTYAEKHPGKVITLSGKAKTSPFCPAVRRE